MSTGFIKIERMRKEKKSEGMGKGPAGTFLYLFREGETCEDRDEIKKTKCRETILSMKSGRKRRMDPHLKARRPG